MATGMSVGGLVSGLDTAGLIAQLMQAEAAPQQALRNKVTREQSVIGAYQAISLKFATMKTQGDLVAKPQTWQTLSVTSSSPTVSASATTAATSGSITFKVTSLAAAHAVRTDPVAGLAATVVTDPAVGVEFFDKAGVSKGKVVPADGSLESLVTAVNANKDLGVTAAAVAVGNGDYVLQLTAGKTGEASEFTVTGLSVPTKLLSQASDAAISVGDLNPYTVKSATNTFTDVLAGVTFTVSVKDPAASITLTSQRDDKALADKMQALVDSINAASAEIDKNTAMGAKTKAGALAGDYAMRQLDTRIADSVNTPLTGSGNTLATIGIQLDRSGKVVFDREKFLSALGSAAAGTQTAATEVAQRFAALGDSVSDARAGSLPLAVQRHDENVQNLNDQIDAWDSRLEMRKQALQRQFTGMEAALGRLRDQSSWLSGQLGSLPTYG
ncbi:MAG TPA: flagellar filament capping protein FliD [Mycobacteriales bacterium]|jgi:flagellar hook-associated protein 2|nr:flagellar filament capping protein FliD [Mycobacteriales bacterium]